MNQFFKRKSNLFLLILEIIMVILGILSLVDNVFFLTTKRETNAEVIKIENLPQPKPYKVTLKYYNDFLNKDIISYVDNIDGSYGEKLPAISGNIKIYYRKYFPKEIYLVDYKYPNNGYILLNIVFLLIIILAIYFQIPLARSSMKN